MGNPRVYIFLSFNITVANVRFDTYMAIVLPACEQLDRAVSMTV